MDILSKIKELITKHGILFGSRKWGGASSDSDWDYIISNSIYEQILPMLKASKEVEIHYHKDKDPDYGMAIGNDMSCLFKILNNGAFVNLVSFPDDKIPLCKQAIEYVSQYSPFPNKDRRHRECERAFYFFLRLDIDERKAK